MASELRKRLNQLVGYRGCMEVVAELAEVMEDRGEANKPENAQVAARQKRIASFLRDCSKHIDTLAGTYIKEH